MALYTTQNMWTQVVRGVAEIKVGVVSLKSMQERNDDMMLIDLLQFFLNIHAWSSTPFHAIKIKDTFACLSFAKDNYIRTIEE